MTLKVGPESLDAYNRRMVSMHRQTTYKCIIAIVVFSQLLGVVPSSFSKCACDQTDQSSWHFFRGGQFDGTSNETGLINSWPDKGPPVLWLIDLGVGYSGFVGQDERVYTQYQSLTGQFVVCLDAKTGRKVWEHRYAWPYKPASLYPGPRSSPTICGDRIFYTTPEGNVGCLELETGKLVWEFSSVERFESLPVEFGYACSPVIVDDLLVLPMGGPEAAMVALDPKDGKLIWKSGDYSISYCSAYPISFEGQPLVIGYFKNSICVFDFKTGEELVSFDVSVDYDEHSAWPIYREPFLWFSGPFRAGCQLKQLVREKDRIRFEHVYKKTIMSNDVASCVRVGDALFGFDIRDVQSKVHRPSRGRFICMQLSTGEQLWENGTLGRRKLDDETISSSSNVSVTDIGHASVIVADEKLIMLNDTGLLIVAHANPEKYVEIGRSKILGGEIVWTGVTLHNRCLFARNHSRATCVYLGELELLESNGTIEFADEVSQPEFLNLAPIILGTEPKYAMSAPKVRWLLDWFVISIAFGWLLAPAVAYGVGKLTTKISTRLLFLIFAFCVGVFGTTIVGRYKIAFYFSWPVALFIVFEVLVCQLKSRDVKVIPHPILARISLLFFLALCVGYFLLCRRLSLAFQWAFLMGFPMALPFLWQVKRSVQRGDKYSIKQWAYSAVAFSAFFWAGAGIIVWKYGV